jgi:hypothetical protein
VSPAGQFKKNAGNFTNFLVEILYRSDISPVFEGRLKIFGYPVGYLEELSR